MPTCSAGYSPDIIMRLPMPVGPFDEPWGTDCFFNEVGFQIMGALVIVLNVVFFFVVLADTLPLRGDGLIQFGSCALLLGCVSHVAFVVCGLYAPLACRAVWVVCMTSCAAYLMAYLLKFSLAGRKLLHSLGAHLTIFDLFGGPVWGRVFIVVWTLATLSVFVSGIVSAALFDPEDESAAADAQHAHFASLALWSSCVIYSQQTLSTTYINTVEHINARVAEIRSQDPSPPSPRTQSSAVEAEQDEVMLMLYRFKIMRVGGKVAFPLGVGVNVVHAFILPVISYLALFQLFNSTFAGLVGWYGLTSTNRRLRAIHIATCGLMGKRGTDSSSRKGAVLDDALVGGGGSKEMGIVSAASPLQTAVASSSSKIGELKA